MKRIAPVFTALVLLAGTTTCFAQSLRDQIGGIFGDALEIGLAGSPGEHGEHFSPANVETSRRMIDALAAFIAANTSNLTLSSTTAGVTFDLSTGVPVRTTTSFGPILAERAQTLGRGRINIGWNVSIFELSRLRGVDLGDVRFTFTHADVDEPGLGDSDNELDTIDLNMNLALNSLVMVFFASYGVTDRLDVGAAVPFVNVELEASPVAEMNSFTLLTNDSANHFYGGTTDNPILTRSGQVKDDAVGLGDILIRIKYHFLRRNALHLAALVDLRPPTGDESDFLGSGSFSGRGALIVSGAAADFSPHLNLAYNLRTGDLENDYLEMFAGFDRKVVENLTIAADFLGKFQVQESDPALDFPQTATIQRPVGATIWRRQVELTNLPNRSRDHLMDIAVGLRWVPRAPAMLLANVTFPINDDGLRADAIYTLGIEFHL